MKTILLMEYASEVGMEYLKCLLHENIQIHSIICIGDSYSEKREALLKERTGGMYARPSFSGLLTESTIPIYIVDDINSLQCYQLLDNLNPDLVVMESSRIIKSPLYEIPTIGIVNTHIAILPYMRGCSCLEWAVLEDMPIGATSHFVLEKVDAGPIIHRVLLDGCSRDNYETIRTKAIYLQAYTMVQGVIKILKRQVEFNNALLLDGGPWYSPMRDEADVQKVKKKLRDGMYLPSKIQDDYPIDIIEVCGKTGRVELV